MADSLSKDHVVLLAVNYVSEGSVPALISLASQRQDALTADLILRVLLTFLPESADPSSYAQFVDNATSRTLSEQHESDELDLSSVRDISEKQARKRVKALHFVPLNHPSCPSSEGLLTNFIVSRAHQLDAAGLLLMVPSLVEPFLDRSEYLRTWFVSNILPLLRFTYDYYPDNHSTPSLDTVETATGGRMVEIWLSKAAQEPIRKDHEARSPVEEDKDVSRSIVARDMKGLVGPWMFGDNERKRRRLNDRERRPSTVGASVDELVRQITSSSAEDGLQTEWENAFTWMVQHSASQIPIVAQALEEWDGPKDVDLGGFAANAGLEPQVEAQLRHRYLQTAFASVYAATTDTTETISSSHRILVRIARLMNLDSPPAMAAPVQHLPKIGAQNAIVGDFPSSIFALDALLRPSHPLTNPNLETFSLLQLLVFSAYILAELRFNLSVMHVARVKFQFDSQEQMAFLQKVLHAVSAVSKRDERQWVGVRQKLLWLWGWGIASDTKEQHGTGVLGRVERLTLEKEILKLLLNASCYSLIIDTYIRNHDGSRNLDPKDVEKTVVEVALNHYDNATNGNRTRGSMKKASEIVLTLRQYFPGSALFQQTEALLTATHALSFYSLMLQHGVPFLPVNIRVSSDPLSLIEKVLAQNPRSYSHLDDLISIATNLVVAGLGRRDEFQTETTPTSLAISKRRAERRAIGMAIEAALNEDDFETAYSYVVNRLDTTAAAQTSSNQDVDDISWRAALAAGRHKSNNLSASTSLSTPPALRRLEQRMELLSQALLLAPPSALPEVLNVWRKCEEEMTALLARESDDETAFDDRADKGLPGAFVNTTVPIQPRREVGRAAQEEAPMGLFDVARGAAAAFSRNAFPLRAQAQTRSPSSPTHARNFSSAGSEADSIRSDGSEDGGKPGRRRKRDMVADAVTGGLASGIGWVLGATPVNQQQR